MNVKGFTVVLEEDLKEEDFAAIKNAVEMTKGVLYVEPILAKAGDDQIIRHRTLIEAGQKVLKAVNDLMK